MRSHLLFKLLITISSNTLELFVDAYFIFLFLCFGIVGMQCYYNYKYESMMRLVFNCCAAFWLKSHTLSFTKQLGFVRAGITKSLFSKPQTWSLSHPLPVSCRMLIWGSYLVQFTQTKPKTMLCVFFWLLRFSIATKPK